MNYLIDNKIKALPVFQNQQDFLIGVFAIGTILKFTKYTKRLIVGFDENNVPIYNPQIQREVENSRIQKIADFLIEDPNATFPTNIVLHIPSNIINSQKNVNDFVEIELEEKVIEGIEKAKVNDEKGDVFITIIDGQHRIRGIEIAIERLDNDIKIVCQTIIGSPNNIDLQKKRDRYTQRKQDLLNMQLVVSFFVDKSLEYQAMIFSTINRTQKRVSDSLVLSLFGLNTDDSPQKTSLQVVLALNGHLKSPFYNRVNLYGNEYEVNQSPPLSQAGMVKSIINLISENLRDAELDRYRSRKELFKRSESSSKNLPMRDYYARNDDSKISDILFFYFNSVKDTFLRGDGSSLWSFNPEKMKPTNILQTTVGYQALLKILVDILSEVKSENDRVSKEKYSEFLKKCKGINFEDTKTYNFTSKSSNLLYYDMSLLIWKPLNAFDKRLQKREEILKRE